MKPILLFVTLSSIFALNINAQTTYIYKKHIPAMPVVYTAQNSDLQLSTNSISMGSTDVGTSSSTQSISVLNTGDGPVSFTVATTGPFTSNTSCSTALPSGQSCLINVVYNASSQGDQTGSLSLTTTAQTLNASLHGIGLKATLSSDSAPTVAGTVSTGANVSATAVFKNTGNKAATGFYVETPSGWSSSGNCPTAASTLSAGGSCTTTISQNAITGAQNVNITAHATGLADVSVAVSYTGQAPADPYLNNVGFLMTGESGLVNEAPSGVTFTTSATAPTISTTDKVFGTKSIRFNSDIDYIRTNASSALGFGSGDFTMETWVKVETWNNAGFLPILDMRVNYWYDALPAIYYNGGNIMFAPAGASTPAFALNEWHHVVYSKNGTTGRLFVDGILKSTVPDTNNYGATGMLTFGQAGDAQSGALTCTFCNVVGNFDNVRITKGVGRYTSNFTPADTPKN